MEADTNGSTLSRMSSRALRFWRLAVLGPGLPPGLLLRPSPAAFLLPGELRHLYWLPRGDPKARVWLRLTALPDLHRIAQSSPGKQSADVKCILRSNLLSGQHLMALEINISHIMIWAELPNTAWEL